MIYVIQGNEECFIRNKISEIIKENQGELIRFDGLDKNFTVDIMLEACNGNTLFSEGSIVLVDQPYFLIRKVNEGDTEKLEQYFQNPVYETQLILYTLLDNFNSRLKTYKAAVSNAQLIRLDSLDYKNFNTYVRQRIKEEKLDINNDTAFMLNNLCKRSATLLNQNLEILKLYPEKITSQVISHLCTASDENDSFEMINSLTNRDISKAISCERKLLSQNDSVLSVIGLLSSQLRFLYYISYLLAKGKKKSEIMDEANISDYRYGKAIETLKNLKMRQIIELLAKLSDLDCQCKSDNSVGDNTRFELFILNLLRKGNNYAGD